MNASSQGAHDSIVQWKPALDGRCDDWHLAFSGSGDLVHGAPRA